MWIDEEGAANTTWIPPASILGSSAVEFLSALDKSMRQRLVVELDAHYDEVIDRSVEALSNGIPALHPAVSDVPTPVGLAALREDQIATELLLYVASLPPVWQIEAFEAISESLCLDD